MPLCSLVRREKVSSPSHVLSCVHRGLELCAVLDAEGKIAFQNYLNRGNFVGIHSASDSLNTTAFFGQEVGQ